MHSDIAYTVLEVSTLITVWALMGVEPGYPVARGWSVPVVQGFASGDMFFFFFLCRLSPCFHRILTES